MRILEPIETVAKKRTIVIFFKEGRFTDEGITMEQKIAKNIPITKEMGISEDEAKN
jgi:hypothetical protein